MNYYIQPKMYQLPNTFEVQTDKVQMRATGDAAKLAAFGIAFGLGLGLGLALAKSRK